MDPLDLLNKCRKYIWQNTTPVYENTVRKLGIEGNFLNLIKNIINKKTKITPQLILYLTWKQETSSLNSGTE